MTCGSSTATCLRPAAVEKCFEQSFSTLLRVSREHTRARVMRRAMPSPERGSRHSGHRWGEAPNGASPASLASRRQCTADCLSFRSPTRARVARRGCGSDEGRSRRQFVRCPRLKASVVIRCSSLGPMKGDSLFHTLPCAGSSLSRLFQTFRLFRWLPAPLSFFPCLAFSDTDSPRPCVRSGLARRASTFEQYPIHTCPPTRHASRSPYESPLLLSVRPNSRPLVAGCWGCRAAAACGAPRHC